MNLTRRTVLIATAASISLAGCAGEMPDDDADETPDDDSSGATVQVRSHPEHGDVLVGPDGVTLYNFDADTQGDPSSACDDGCDASWPPLTVEEAPRAGAGVTAELSTFEREDGSTQVVANGWPLYYFASDESPGDAEGQGVNDAWWVLRPDGTPIRTTGDDGNGGDGGDGDDTDDSEDGTGGYGY